MTIIPKNPKTVKPKKLTHKQHIMNALNKGIVLDDMKALNMFGCWSLSQRIGELIKSGVPIKKDWGYSPSGKRYMTYFLLEQDQKGEQP